MVSPSPDIEMANSIDVPTAENTNGRTIPSRGPTTALMPDLMPGVDPSPGRTSFRLKLLLYVVKRGDDRENLEEIVEAFQRVVGAKSGTASLEAGFRIGNLELVARRLDVDQDELPDPETEEDWVDVDATEEEMATAADILAMNNAHSVSAEIFGIGSEPLPAIDPSDPASAEEDDTYQLTFLHQIYQRFPEFFCDLGPVVVSTVRAEA